MFLLLFLLTNSVHVLCLSHLNTGYDLVKNPLLNKGTSFTLEERQHYHLHGLIGSCDPIPLTVKVENLMTQFHSKKSSLDKYIFLHTIQDSDETLYYAALCQYTTELMPYVYTPTVGEACVEWSHITRSVPRGVYLSMRDRGNIQSILQNYPLKNIKVTQVIFSPSYF